MTQWWGVSYLRSRTAPYHAHLVGAKKHHVGRVACPLCSDLPALPTLCRDEKTPRWQSKPPSACPAIVDILAQHIFKLSHPFVKAATVDRVTQFIHYIVKVVDKLMHQCLCRCLACSDLLTRRGVFVDVNSPISPDSGLPEHTMSFSG